MILPPKWQAEDLEQQARASLATFVRRRLADGSTPYQEVFASLRPHVDRLFDLTANLTTMDADLLVQNPELVESARFLAGPPLSQDDLDTFSGGKVTKRRRILPEYAKGAMEALKAFLDPIRCSWVADGSQPSPAAREAAVRWTTGLWAVERCRTAWRTESSARQERAVADMCLACGFEEVEGLKKKGIQSLDELARRQFARETILGQPKADLVVRLGDGRLVAIECKVSNSALNSVKRLNRETVGKADTWKNLYGQQVVTAAVLSGVFKVSNLVDAQDAGVFIFWDHDLTSLQQFLVEASGG